MKTLRLVRLFAERQVRHDENRLLTGLPVLAFGVVTALALIVVAGGRAVTSLDSEFLGMYQFFATVALSLLTVPLVTLGAAAAKLATRRRDARLSSLRLLGATTASVSALAVLEAAVGAFVGAVLGTLGYALLVPIVSLVPLGGAPLAGQLWLPIWVLPLAWIAVALVAAGSAALGLRDVALTPLAVRTRQRPRIARGRRAIIAAVLVTVGIGLIIGLQSMAEFGGFYGMLVGIFVAFACGFLALDAIGPWYIALRARWALRKAADVEDLLAARMALDDPLATWRQVGGLAVTTFVGVVGAGGLGLLSLANRAAAAAGYGLVFDDIRTGIILTLIVAFIMVAATVAINQSAAMLDRSRVQVSLDRLGVPQNLLASAARSSVMLSVKAVVVGAAVLGVALTMPMLSVSAILSPASLATMAAVIFAGILVVRLGASVAGRLVPDILAHPDRAL